MQEKWNSLFRSPASTRPRLALPAEPVQTLALGTDSGYEAEQVRKSSRHGRFGTTRIRDVVIWRLARRALSTLLAAAILLVVGNMRPVEAQTVQAVLFFSPTCQHCHHVITQYLPSLFGTYGGQPAVVYDQSIPQNELSLILFRNSQLELLLVDASKPLGGELYTASTRAQQIPYERSGVPRLVIGDEYMVGSIEIPERTGDLVKEGLEQGGLGWPAIDGLVDALAEVPSTAPLVTVQDQDSAAAAQDSAPAVAEEPEDTATTQPEEAPVDSVPAPVPSAEPTDTVLPVLEDTAAAPPVEPTRPAIGDQEGAISPVEQPRVDSARSAVSEPSDTGEVVASAFDIVPTRELTMLENFQLDPVGNGFSVAVLLLMIVSVVVVWLNPHVLPAKLGLGILVPLLALVGAGVAAYLTYIEATGATAVCGPVGDCNTVNQSEYARLFGLLPVGALGLMGYAAIAVAWAASRYAAEKIGLWARVALYAMAVGGTLFSIYLTFLEPFVIGATCAWCLTSSIIMTALLWLFASGGRNAWAQIRSTAS